MALILSLLERTFGANSPEYIAEYASVNNLTIAQATIDIENDPSLLPAYLELYGRKWTLSESYLSALQDQRVFKETNNSSPNDNKVVFKDYDGEVIRMSKAKSTQVCKHIARALRERDIALVGEANVVSI